MFKSICLILIHLYIEWQTCFQIQRFLLMGSYKMFLLSRDNAWRRCAFELLDNANVSLKHRETMGRQPYGVKGQVGDSLTLWHRLGGVGTLISKLNVWNIPLRRRAIAIQHLSWLGLCVSYHILTSMHHGCQNKNKQSQRISQTHVLCWPEKSQILL